MGVLVGRKVAMLYIHPGTALSCAQKIVTDADQQMTRANEGVTGARSKSIVSFIFSNAKHGLCVWHLLDRNLKNSKEYKALLAAAKGKSIFARAEIGAILRWLWYFARHYETREEIEVASYLLLKYLTESQKHHFASHDKDFCRKIKEFITTKYLENDHKYFDAYFPGMTMGLVLLPGTRES